MIHRARSALRRVTGGVAVGAALAGCGGGHAHQTTQSVPASPETTVTQVLPGADRPQVTLGDKNTPEQFLLGELYDQALSAEGFSVTLTRNIGPSSVYLAALAQGSLDMYPEYLNVWTGQVAGQATCCESFRATLDGGEAYAASHALELLAPTPFSDIQAIAVTTAFARAHRLRTLGDLRRVADNLTLGAPLEFSQDPAGLPAIEQAYGFQPAATDPIGIGEQYTDLRDGTVQAAYVNTTDGELSTPEFTVLRDPRHVLGYGNVVPVATTSMLNAEGPSFRMTVDRVSALLTMPVIRGLNAELEVPGETPTGLAREFLIAHGLVPDTPADLSAG